jgi:hypothetical protein
MGLQIEFNEGHALFAPFVVLLLSRYIHDPSTSLG